MDKLSVLAFAYRGTKNLEERREIAKIYAEQVELFIKSGTWDEIPAREDQLPDDDMPDSFFKYWKIR
jgi:hypothetical protein